MADSDPGRAENPSVPPGSESPPYQSQGPFPGPDFEELAGPFAAFHAAVFVAASVLALHLAGAVGDVLAGLDTLVGIVAYLLLWGVTWLTNRRWIAGVPAAGWHAAARPMHHYLRAVAWGGATGVGFLWCGLALFLAIRLVETGTDPSLLRSLAVVLALVLGIGTAVAAILGGAVGAVFGALDYALLGIAARIGPAASIESTDVPAEPGGLSGADGEPAGERDGPPGGDDDFPNENDSVSAGDTGEAPD